MAYVAAVLCTASACEQNEQAEPEPKVEAPSDEPEAPAAGKAPEVGASAKGDEPKGGDAKSAPEDDSKHESDVDGAKGGELERPFKIVEVDSEASQFFYGVVDAKGKKVSLPKPVADGIYDSLYPKLMSDGRYIVYDVFLEDTKEPELRFYDFATGKDDKLVRFYPGSTMLEYGWMSPDGRTLLAVNQNASREGYGTKLFALTIVDGKLTKKKKHSIEPHVHCGSLCYVVEMEFVGPKKVRYLEAASVPDPPPHQRRYREVKL